MDKKSYRKDITDEFQADLSQLDNAYTSPIITGNYDLMSSEELDEVTFLEDEIESLQSEFDELEDDEVVKSFFRGWEL